MPSKHCAQMYSSKNLDEYCNLQICHSETKVMSANVTNSFSWCELTGDALLPVFASVARDTRPRGVYTLLLNIQYWLLF